MRGLGLCAALLFALFAHAGLALSQDSRTPQAPTTYTFQLSRQALADALGAYSRITGVEILYESRIAAGLSSSPVEGEFSPERALAILLSETDLVARYAHGKAVTLSAPSVINDLPVPLAENDVDLTLDTLTLKGAARPDAESLRAFGASVQVDIEKALRRDERTRSGNYRASVKLWIDRARTVQRAELSTSTGDAGRDLMIPDVLKGLVLRSGPPANTPQPVRVGITVRTM